MRINTRRGFTLFEMLAVIAIMSVLAGVIFINVNEGRAKGRDTKRVNDINQYLVSLKLYAEKEGTYAVAGSGATGGGNGFLGYVYSGYAAVSDTLVSEGLLPATLSDPLLSPSQSNVGTQYNYFALFMSGGVRRGICIFADLERPKTEQVAAYTAARAAVVNPDHVQLPNFNYGRCTS